MTDQPSSSFSAAVKRGTDSISAMPTRRKLLLGGAAVAGAAVVGAYTIGSGAPYAKAASSTKPADRQDLGDGFFLVDGWVLSEADLQR